MAFWSSLVKFVYYNPQHYEKGIVVISNIYQRFYARFPLPVFATEDGEDGDVIDITILLPGESNNRSQIEVPIHAVVYSERECVAVSFAYDIGNVAVQITNLTYSTSTTIDVDSSVSHQIIPITGGPGFYRIEIITSDGTVYYGYFRDSPYYSSYYY